MQRARLERRQFSRFPLVLEVEARGVPPNSPDPQTVQTVRGRIQNLSRGGLCLFTSERLNPIALMVCEIMASELPVSIPALAIVRWSEQRAGQDDCYLYGLQFLC